MRIKSRFPPVSIPVLVSLLFSQFCLAGGAWLTESGGADMAMASAGRAAIAADASTVAANPAGMALLSGDGVLVAAMPLVLEVTVKGDGATAGTVDNRGGLTPAGAVFATQTEGRWAFGLGLYSYLGLGFDYGRQWAGARAVRSAEFMSFNIAPAVAFRLTDGLSVGGSLGAQYASAEGKLAASNDAAFYGPPANLPDGQLRVAGDSWSTSGSLGATYVNNGGARFGLAWTAPVDHSIGLDLHTRGLHPVLDTLLQQSGEGTLEISLPQQFTFGAALPLSPDTLLASSVAWQQWSEFGKAELKLGPYSAPLFDEGLRDTWGVALGVRHRVSPGWTLATGVAYDSDPGKHGRAPIYFPVSEQLRLAFGADYRYNPDVLLRFALSVVNQGDVHIAQNSYPFQLPGMPAVTGKVNGSRIYIGALSLDYRL